MTEAVKEVEKVVDKPQVKEVKTTKKKDKPRRSNPFQTFDYTKMIGLSSNLADGQKGAVAKVTKLLEKYDKAIEDGFTPKPMQAAAFEPLLKFRKSLIS